MQWYAMKCKDMFCMQLKNECTWMNVINECNACNESIVKIIDQLIWILN